MKTRSFPFDSVAQGTNELGFVVGDRDYGSADWAKYISYFLTNGVKNGGDNLKVSQSSQTQISVLDGIALINGRFFEMYEGPAYFDVQLNVISRIVVRLDLTDEVRRIDLKLIDGSAESAPDLVRNEQIYDLAIAQIITDESGITQIIDERADVELCGYINSMITVDATEILTSIENELKKLENQTDIAKKDGTLQKNLDAEMVGGMKADDILKMATVTGVYTGDGETSQSINLGFQPKAVFVFPQKNSASYLKLGLALNGYEANQVSAFSESNTRLVTITQTGFDVYYKSSGSNIYSRTNEASQVYYYLAWKGE